MEPRCRSDVRPVVKGMVGYPTPEELPSGFVKLDANESPYGASPKVYQALSRALKSIHRYPTEPRRLLERLAAYTGLEPEKIILTNGSDEAIDLVLKAFLDPGEEVVLSTPSFPIYGMLSTLAGARVKAVRMLQGFRWDIEGLLGAVTDRTKLVFLSSPNNPTGNSLPLEEALSIADRGAILVLDEAYVEFAGRSLAQALEQRENIIVLRTFSKAFGLAGLRIGYALSSLEAIQALQRVKMPYNVNRLAMVAAEAALDDQGYLAQVVEAVRRGREDLMESFTEVGLKPYPSDANFILVDTAGKGRGSTSLARALFKRGVAVRDLLDLGGFEGSYLRITVGTPEENSRLIQALREVLTEGKASVDSEGVGQGKYLG